MGEANAVNPRALIRYDDIWESRVLPRLLEALHRAFPVLTSSESP